MIHIGIGDRVLTAGGNLGQVTAINGDEYDITYIGWGVPEALRKADEHHVTLKRSHIRRFDPPEDRSSEWGLR